MVTGVNEENALEHRTIGNETLLSWNSKKEFQNLVQIKPLQLFRIYLSHLFPCCTCCTGTGIGCPKKPWCPIPESFQGQIWWGFEQPGLVEGAPTHSRWIGTRRSLPTQRILWFYLKWLQSFKGLALNEAKILCKALLNVQECLFHPMPHEIVGTILKTLPVLLQPYAWKDGSPTGSNAHTSKKKKKK